MAQRSEDGVGKTSERSERLERAKDPIRDLHTGQRRVKGRINRLDRRKHLIRPRQNLEKTSCI